MVGRRVSPRNMIFSHASRFIRSGLVWQLLNSGVPVGLKAPSHQLESHRCFKLLFCRICFTRTAHTSLTNALDRVKLGDNKLPISAGARLLIGGMQGVVGAFLIWRIANYRCEEINKRGYKLPFTPDVHAIG